MPKLDLLVGTAAENMGSVPADVKDGVGNGKLSASLFRNTSKKGVIVAVSPRRKRIWDRKG